jgi:hypothetical protein
VRSNLDPRLVCIVGPNAAGKSSFLRALASMTDSDGLDFGAVDHTRSHAGERITVCARYELDVDDHAELVAVPEARNATHLIVRKISGRSDRALDLEPVPVRDRQPRAELARKLETFRRSKWVANRASHEVSDGLEVTDALLARTARGLVEVVEDLSDETLADMQELATRLSTASEAFKQARQLQSTVADRLDRESSRHPHDLAVGLLVDRIPPFVEFHEDLRQLAATYNVDEEADEAILNVLQLADTDWDALRTAVDGDPGRRRTWVERADRAAQQKLAEW